MIRHLEYSTGTPHREDIMLTERQQDIFFETLGYATLIAGTLTLLLERTDFYLVGAAVTVTLLTIYASISYLSTKGDDE